MPALDLYQKLQEDSSQVVLSSRLHFFIALLGTLCLLGTVSNFIVISASSALLFFLIPLFLISQRSTEPLVLSTLMVFVLFVISTLAYAPSSLIDYAFYRYDGNIFISFLPLILYAPLKINLDFKKICNFFLLWGSGINIFCLGIFFIQRFILGTAHTYHFLFHAHNAAGGFLITLTTLSLAYFIYKKNLFYFTLFT